MADQRRASAFASYDRDLSDPWASRQSGLSTLANGSSTAPYTVPETTSGSVIADSDWPESYHAAWASLAVSGGNAVPFDQLQKLLAETGLSSAQVARIVQLSSLRAPRVGRGEFAVALALAALAQQGQECTIEAVVSRKTSPPEPSLPSVGNRPRKVSLNGVAASDPWASRGASASPEISTSNQLAQSHYPGADFATSPGGFGGETEDTEPAVWPATLERDREVVTVELDPELAGKWLGKFSLYHVGCQKRGTIVPRRFSDFAWLLGCLERRYAFRLLPTMPPKRVALNGSHAFADAQFIERRRRGLQRVGTFLINHPVLGRDALVTSFFTEPSDFALWRKSHPVSLEDEAATRQLTAAEEMAVPGDLEARLTSFRERLPQLIAGWTSACQIVERIARRREAEGADFSRLALGIDTLVLADAPPLVTFDGVDGVARDLRHLSESAVRLSDKHRRRCDAMLGDVLERLKAHRELYSDFGLLFGRHDRLAPDAIDKLTKRVEGAQRKLENVRQDRPKWQDERDALVAAIEADQKAIEALQKRRLTIKFAMWEELRLLARLSTLLSVAIRTLATDEGQYAEQQSSLWSLLSDHLGALA